jgi:hypothetical protein
MAEKLDKTLVDWMVVRLVAQTDFELVGVRVVSSVEWWVVWMVYLMEKMRVEHLDSTKAVSMVGSLVFQKVVLTDNWKVFELVVWKDNY